MPASSTVTPRTAQKAASSTRCHPALGAGQQAWAGRLLLRSPVWLWVTHSGHPWPEPLFSHLCNGANGAPAPLDSPED